MATERTSREALRAAAKRLADCTTSSIEQEQAMLERLLSMQADLEAAARYRRLAESNPSLKRDYLKRADLCETIAKGKRA